MKFSDLRNSQATIAEALEDDIRAKMQQVIAQYKFAPKFEDCIDVQQETGDEAVRIVDNKITYFQFDKDQFHPYCAIDLDEIIKQRNNNLLDEASMASDPDYELDIDSITVETANGYTTSIFDAIFQACDPEDGYGLTFMGVRESCGAYEVFAHEGFEVNISSLFFCTPDKHIVHILYLGEGTLDIEYVKKKALKIVRSYGYKYSTRRSFEG